LHLRDNTCEIVLGHFAEKKNMEDYFWPSTSLCVAEQRSSTNWSDIGNDERI